MASSKARKLLQTFTLWSFNKTQALEMGPVLYQEHRLWNTLGPDPASTQCTCYVTPGSQVAPAGLRSSWLQGVGHKAMHTQLDIR